MLYRLPSALARMVLVVLLIALPSLLLPGEKIDNTQVVALVAIFAGLFTLVEYCSNSPSLVEFRDAPPFNRVRFCALFATVLSLSVIFRGTLASSGFTQLFLDAGIQLGRGIDFPYSPVRLLVFVMPEEADPALRDGLRASAGISYIISLMSVIWFVVLLSLQHWPRRGEAFNVWINLPTFDPTAGGDVVRRLYRDGRVNIILGLLLPFLVPGIVRLGAYLGAPLNLSDPQTLIWMVTAWAFLPAGLVMRGVALSRVARMIALQRKRAYEKAAAAGMLAA